jgi:hypothetical protein
MISRSTPLNSPGACRRVLSYSIAIKRCVLSTNALPDSHINLPCRCGKLVRAPSALNGAVFVFVFGRTARRAIRASAQVACSRYSSGREPGFRSTAARFVGAQYGLIRTKGFQNCVKKILGTLPGNGESPGSCRRRGNRPSLSRATRGSGATTIPPREGSNRNRCVAHPQSELPKPRNTTAAPGVAPISSAHWCSQRYRSSTRRISNACIAGCNQRASAAASPFLRDGRFVPAAHRDRMRCQHRGTSQG